VHLNSETFVRNRVRVIEIGKGLLIYGTIDGDLSIELIGPKS
jgi:hypothetical protein